MPKIEINDSSKSVVVESDQGFKFNEGGFVSLVSTLDKIRDIIHATQISFVKNKDGGSTYDFLMVTQEDEKLEQHITFAPEDRVLYSISSGNSWDVNEWQLIDLLTSQCADLAIAYGATAINCTWS